MLACGQHLQGGTPRIEAAPCPTEQRAKVLLLVAVQGLDAFGRYARKLEALATTDLQMTNAALTFEVEEELEVRRAPGVPFSTRSGPKRTRCRFPKVTAS